MRRVRRLGFVTLALAPIMGCSGSATSTPPEEIGGASGSIGGSSAGGSGAASGGASSGTGGQSAATTGGSVTSALTTGGLVSTGGVPPTGGTKAGTGGSSKAGTGGTPSTGGSKSNTGGLPATGGAVATGGFQAAGSPGTGGITATGGSKASTGGSSAATGGSKSATGGTPATGGSKATTGGTPATGGNASSCSADTSAPPSNVSAWINESYAGQLGSNVKGRKDWLLDNIMMGKGQINLCVRWGASTAPTAAVKTGMAAAVQKWMNDWFTTLNYGGFPYCNGVTTKVTGWAVKPGNTSWVSDLDPSIKVYTEVDAEGEPKCPDACSFFNNWTHTFPSCAGGEAFHTDYWLWLDDSISGGATAVGGDWGLRIATSNFITYMGKSNLVIEHEMGHGFGFQDYYDWTGSTPTGGSLMIVGSTNSQVPTTGDIWLLRRTWMEMKALRGW